MKNVINNFLRSTFALRTMAGRVNRSLYKIILALSLPLVVHGSWAAATAPTIVTPGSVSSPGSTISGLTPTFTWNSATNATGYGLYIRDMTTNTLIYPNASGITSTPLSGTSYSLPSGYLVNGHTYRWAMTSFTNSTESAQSGYLYFQTSAPVSTIPASERAVLTNLYTSTNGASWTNNSNWNGPVGSECSWFGVTCDGTQSHVTGIDLGVNNLVGTLPSISGLIALQWFNVGNLLGNGPYYNQLIGPIPSLNGLSALKSFDVRINQLTGAIPSLSGLTALQEFNVDENKLTGTIPSLSGLTALRIFMVSGNKLTGAIPSLSGLTALDSFGVGLNQLTGTIPSLSGLTALSLFDVRGNQLTGAIPSLTGLTALANLGLAGNHLTGSIPSLTGVPLRCIIAGGDWQYTQSVHTANGPITYSYSYAETNLLTGPVPSAPSSLIAPISPDPNNPNKCNNLCGNRLVSSGNPTTDAAWATASGTDWLACQLTPDTTSGFHVGAEVIADQGGTYIRNQSGNVIFLLGSADGTIHGTIVDGPSTNPGFSGNAWKIEWDSVSPPQDSGYNASAGCWSGWRERVQSKPSDANVDCWSAQSAISISTGSELIPPADGIPEPKLMSENYVQNNIFFNKINNNVRDLVPDVICEKTNLGSCDVKGQASYGNCTWYASGRLHELSDKQSSTFSNLINKLSGSACQWANQAASAGIPIDNIPEPGDIAFRQSDSYSSSGHVAVVEWVSPDKKMITVSESSYTKNVTSEYNYLWRRRTVSANWFTEYIHVSKGASTSTNNANSSPQFSCIQNNGIVNPELTQTFPSGGALPSGGKGTVKITDGLGDNNLNTVNWTFSQLGNGPNQTAGFIKLSGDPKSPPESPPPGVSFPYGLVDFVLVGQVSGSQAIITITYPGSLPPGTVYYKFGPTPDNQSPHWYQFPATISGNTVTLKITDGGLGDDDLQANGAIIDQGGPGVPAALTAIPSLSKGAMILLGFSILLSCGAIFTRRRQRL